MAKGTVDFDTTDILLRCDSCSRLVSVKRINKLGSCNHCGNRRFRTVTMLTPKEHKYLTKGIYQLGDSYKNEKMQDFLKCFSEVKEEGDK